MSKSFGAYLFSVGLVLFTILNVYLISIDKPFAVLVPIGVILVWAVTQHLNKLMLFISFATPFSMNLEGLDKFGGIGFYFPTEPLLVGVMLVYGFWRLLGKGDERSLMRHPVTLAILFMLFWIFITACTSSLPVVSFKFLVSRLWFVVPLYFLAARLFREPGFIRRYFWAYIVGLCVVILMTLYKHAGNGFDQMSGHYVMNPWYKDHTSYGAAIALFYPLVLASLFKKEMVLRTRAWVILATIIMTTGLIFSYTRAAWLSLVGALGVFVVMKLRIKFWLVALVMSSLTVGYVVFQDDITRELERNRQDSSENFTEHIQSMTNVSTDASNLERLNRWASAWRLFEERPYLGWGPGTYMFQYAPFQKSSEKTIISTNHGDAGNAHSEYLGPLCESGVIGMLAIIMLIIVVLYTGITLYGRLDDPELKALVMAMLLGLITYFIHGVLNNFLDTDKISVPFWGFCAGIVAIDLYHRNRKVSTAKSS